VDEDLLATLILGDETKALVILPVGDSALMTHREWLSCAVLQLAAMRVRLDPDIPSDRDQALR